MAVDGLDRHCSTCARKVHDLSARTEAEARTLLVLSSGSRLCVRFRSTPEGVPLFRRAGTAAAAASMSTLLGCGAPSAPAERPPAVTVALSAARRDPPAPAPQAALPQGSVTQSSSAPVEVDVPESRPRVVVQTMGVVIIPLIVFDKGSPKLDASSDAVLDEVASMLRQSATITLLEISGHTSSDESAPETLGLARATAVIDDLVKRGIDRGRLVARSAGSSEPVEMGTTAAARARNRRASFRVVTTP